MQACEVCGEGWLNAEGICGNCSAEATDLSPRGGTQQQVETVATPRTDVVRLDNEQMRLILSEMKKQIDASRSTRNFLFILLFVYPPILLLVGLLISAG